MLQSNDISNPSYAMDNPAFSGQEKSAPQYPDPSSNFANKFEGYSQEGIVGYTGILFDSYSFKFKKKI